jgi:secondary thiamine-phosphate synthase enzyme
MRQTSAHLLVTTDGQGLYEITDRVGSWVAAQGIPAGLLTVYLHHTSASLLIQENADADVLRDLNDFFRRLVPEDTRHYRHTEEGPDDMPAHIRAALTTTHLSIPVAGGRPDLGRWQGIFLFEHRARRHERRITLHLLGE